MRDMFPNSMKKWRIKKSEADNALLDVFLID